MGRKKKKRKTKPQKSFSSWYPFLIGIGLVAIIIFFIFNGSGESLPVESPEPVEVDIQERPATTDEHSSDYIESKSSIDAQWGTAVATSKKGDQEFLVDGTDYHEVFVASDAKTFSFLVTLHEPVEATVEYEFYLISENQDYQLRINPSQGAVLWKRDGPEVMMIDPPELFEFAIEEHSLSAQIPKGMFPDEDIVRLHVEIFNNEHYFLHHDAEAAHDSGQFKEPIEIEI